MCRNKESCGKSVNFSQNKQKSSHRPRPYVRSFTVDKNLENDFGGINVVKREKFRTERCVNSEPLECQLNIDEQIVSFEVDSGAAATVMCYQEYRERFGKAELSEVSNKFKVITGANIITLGQKKVRVWFNGVMHLLNLIIISTDRYI